MSGSELKWIVFTGSDVYAYVPGYKEAKRRGILLANAPGANSYAVAEYSLMLMLLMLRRGVELGRTGTETFITTQSLQDAHVGIVGMGKIGERVARMLTGLGTASVSYTSRTRKNDLEQELGITYLSPEELFSTCDVITNHLPTSSGQPITAALIKMMKRDNIFVSTGGDTTFDKDALYEAIQNQGIRVAFDMHSTVPDDCFRDLPFDKCFYSNANAAYNTVAACRLASDMAVETIINIKNTGHDQFVVEIL